MATLKNGLSGHISGKVGSVIYCKWKNVEYVRSRPHLKKNKKPSDSQKKNRSKFGFMQERLGKITPFLRLGFMNYELNRTGYNSAMSYNLLQAIVENDSGYTIDYPRFAFAKGIVSPITKTVITKKDQHYTVQWEYDAAFVQKRNLDFYRALILFYPESLLESPRGIVVGAPLVDKMDTIQFHQPVKGVLYHAYLAFFAVDGSNQSVDSIYMGSLST